MAETEPVSQSDQLEKATEDERLARVTIEAALAARHITPEQQRAIGMALTKYGSQIIFIRSNFGDDEAKTLPRAGSASLLSQNDDLAAEIPSLPHPA